MIETTKQQWSPCLIAFADSLCSHWPTTSDRALIEESPHVLISRNHRSHNVTHPDLSSMHPALAPPSAPSVSSHALHTWACFFSKAILSVLAHHPHPHPNISYSFRQDSSLQRCLLASLNDTSPNNLYFPRHAIYIVCNGRKKQCVIFHINALVAWYQKSLFSLPPSMASPKLIGQW